MFQQNFFNFPGIIYEGPLEAFIEKQSDYLERNPDAFECRARLGAALLMMGDPEEACAKLGKAEESRKHYPETPLESCSREYRHCVSLLFYLSQPHCPSG
jgi:hypothetical protein